MQQLECAFVSRQFGVNRDFRGKPGKRQVTVLDINGWRQACEELGKELNWKIRRSNLLVDGLFLANTTGQFIRIGDLVLEITQETDPCNRMEEAEPGLFAALKKDWRGGVCCKVIENGEIQIGDEVNLLSRFEYKKE